MPQCRRTAQSARLPHLLNCRIEHTATEIGCADCRRLPDYCVCSATPPPPPSHKFTMNDVLTILKHLANVERLTTEQIELYDFYGNGKITMSNVLELLKHLAGVRPNMIES